MIATILADVVTSEEISRTVFASLYVALTGAELSILSHLWQPVVIRPGYVASPVALGPGLGHGLELLVVCGDARGLANLVQNFSLF